jgi:hypothetical protein
VEGGLEELAGSSAASLGFFGGKPDGACRTHDVALVDGTERDGIEQDAVAPLPAMLWLEGADAALSLRCPRPSLSAANSTMTG